jgi:hypothetical protein
MVMMAVVPRGEFHNVEKYTGESHDRQERGRTGFQPVGFRATMNSEKATGWKPVLRSIDALKSVH